MEKIREYMHDISEGVSDIWARDPYLRVMTRQTVVLTVITLIGLTRIFLYW